MSVPVPVVPRLKDRARPAEPWPGWSPMFLWARAFADVARRNSILRHDHDLAISKAFRDALLVQYLNHVARRPKT